MSDYGIVTEAGALRYERLLPAPAERVWQYLVESELRRTWFCAGEMELRPGGAMKLVFRNSELSPGEPVPERFQAMEGYVSTGEILEADPPRRLVFLWHEESGDPTEVRWELEPRGERTLLTLVHRRLPSRAMTVDVSGGWHLHLDMLEAVLAGRAPGPFWSRQTELERLYDGLVPAEPSAAEAGS